MGPTLALCRAIGAHAVGTGVVGCSRGEEAVAHLTRVDGGGHAGTEVVEVMVVVGREKQQ